MTLQNIVELIFLPLSILKNNNVPLLNISFLTFWLSLLVVFSSVSLIRYIFNFGISTDTSKDYKRDSKLM